MNVLKTLGLSAVLCFSYATIASAQDGPEGYAVDPESTVVKTLDGCLKTPRWTPEMATMECDPDLVQAEPMAEAPPMVEPTMVQQQKTIATDALFDFDSAQVKPEADANLRELVAEMGQASNIVSIDVIGHTDSTGPESYNQGLSERRAAAVKDAMVGLGVNEALISTSGMGESQPRASNATREGRAQNRRVEVAVEAVVETNP
jgi:OOP family OmpA-OmpF porin